jgi:hypothetical protein
VSTQQELATQIGEELGAALYDPSAAVGDPDFLAYGEQMVASRAAMLAGQLLQEMDDRLSAQTAIDLMCGLWRHGAPEDHDPAWWRTPLGRAIARSAGRDDADAVSYSVAGAMLGVVRGTISQMVARGTLDRHPDGGVLRSSVLARLAAG